MTNATRMRWPRSSSERLRRMPGCAKRFAPTPANVSITVWWCRTTWRSLANSRITRRAGTEGRARSFPCSMLTLLPMCFNPHFSPEREFRKGLDPAASARVKEDRQTRKRSDVKAISNDALQMTVHREVGGRPQTPGLPGTDDEVALSDGVDDIGPTDNANQFAVSDHRDTLNFALGEQLSNLAYGSFFGNDDQFVRHDIGHTQPFTIDLADNIGLRDHADQLSLRINDGRAADALLVEKLRCLLCAGLWLDRTHAAGHNVACDHQALSFGCR